MSGIPIARFLDLLTCRNVTIYFTEHQKDELARYIPFRPCDRWLLRDGENSSTSGRQVEDLFVPV